MAAYFIEVDTYWQNSTSYFVGPFDTRSDAEAWWKDMDEPGANVWLSTSTCGGDIRTAWRIYPSALAKTTARRHGLRRYEDGDVFNTAISPKVKPTARALSRAAWGERDPK